MGLEMKEKYVVPRPRNFYNFGVALFVAVGSLCYGCKLITSFRVDSRLT